MKEGSKTANLAQELTKYSASDAKQKAAPVPEQEAKKIIRKTSKVKK